MEIIALTIIGSRNNPLLIKNFTQTPTLKINLLSNTMIDVFEERSDKTDHYLGLLSVLEDVAVFGYSTTSNVKFLIFYANAQVIIKDSDVKALFKQVHDNYIKLVMNVVGYEVGTQIKSKKFLESIDQIFAGKIS